MLVYSTKSKESIANCSNVDEALKFIGLLRGREDWKSPGLLGSIMINNITMADLISLASLYNKEVSKKKATVAVQEAPSGLKYQLDFRYPDELVPFLKRGKRVRIGVSDSKKEAREVSVEITELLTDSRYWDTEGKRLATEFFSTKAIQAFYKHLHFTDADGLSEI